MDKITQSLRMVGKNQKLVDAFIEFIKKTEQELEYNGSVRDDISRYLVDAMFEKDDFQVKSIQSGIKYKFLTGEGSKIAREFLLSTPTIPEFAWEPQTTKLLLYLSQKAKNVIIGGVYFGDQALPIAINIKQNNGTVHGFDLNEKQVGILKDNMLLNNITNIQPVLKGLWHNSSTYLNLSDTDDLAFATPVSESKISNTITIDDYIEANNLPGVDLIMIDIEGAELNVLKGAEKQLIKTNGYPNIVFEIHRNYVDWSNGLLNTDIVKYLMSMGYAVFSLRDFQGNYDMKNKKIELIKPEETVLDGPSHGFNMVAVKDKSLLENDLFKMCRNLSPKYILHKKSPLHTHTDGF